ncbi:MAG: SAM-dependent methyltransferase [Aestuariivirga sp.]|nr:SAM-dependent methyltransferase [Aestuariivirga sp.]
MSQTNLDNVRRAYAKDMARVSASPDSRLEKIFYSVHREDFLPSGPWKLLVEGRYVDTPNSDPVHVYRNSVIAIDAPKGINNGEPHLHAMWIGAVAPKPGETITQIGLGMGYYSAILSLLVQPGGRLTGFEIESDLAEAARHNLAGFENVSVVTGDAVSLELPPSDVIYVSAAVAAPPESWLAALRPGGRLIFPWRPTVEVALAMLVTRVAKGFEARPLMSSWFIPCAGASSQKGSALTPTPSTARRIHSLHFTRDRAPNESAVAVYEHVWFSSAKLRGYNGSKA